MDHRMATDYFPRLSGKARLRVDRVSGATFLLYPERGLRLNATAAAILSLCDGCRNVAEIARAASHGTDIGPGESEREVGTFLADLAKRGLLENGPA